MEHKEHIPEWKSELEWINKLIFVQNFEKARAALNELVSLYPKEEVLLLRKLELDHKTNHLEMTLDHWKKKSLPYEYILLAELYLKKRTSHEVIEILESKKSDSPSLYHYTMGYCTEMIDDLERAKGNYLKTLQYRSDHPPAIFGLSQIYYQQNDHDKADKYFHEFETFSPYTIYGNFYNHRDLAQEFLDQGLYTEAQTALTTLSSWWTEHRGEVPIEIEIFILLFQSLIKKEAQEASKSHNYLEQAESKLQSALKKDLSSEVLYFIAQQCEVFDQPTLAHNFYSKVLRQDLLDVSVAQRICQSKLAQKEFLEAQELFALAQEKHPDVEEIQFCRLVCDLSQAQLDIETYLSKKDHSQSPDLSDIQKLNLLHELHAMFSSDQDILRGLSESYMKFGQVEKAKSYIQKLEQISHLSSQSRTTLAHFYVSIDEVDLAKTTLEEILKQAPTEANTKVNWLLSMVLVKKGEYKSAQKHLEKLLKKEPWNISYLGSSLLLQMLQKSLKPDPLIESLLKGQDQDLDWDTYLEQTQNLKIQKEFELVYLRSKLQMLYNNDIRSVIYSAASFNSRAAIHDFIKLLNTNFEQPLIYLALGLFHQDLWLHQAAQIWFEQGLDLCEGKDLAACYLGIAESKAWSGQDLRTAKEYAILAKDLLNKAPELCSVVQAHILLKMGDIQESWKLLSNVQEPTLYSEYLRGLVEYRNGKPNEAKKLWKPLLSTASKSPKEDHIKQEIMKFYFDKKPLLEFH